MCTCGGAGGGGAGTNGVYGGNSLTWKVIGYVSGWFYYMTLEYSNNLFLTK